eukprot:1996984-Pyramimonas_sp.AAC.1
MAGYAIHAIEPRPARGVKHVTPWGNSTDPSHAITLHQPSYSLLPLATHMRCKKQDEKGG